MHFVLVHGAWHGSWCWFMLKPLLESSGRHRVTAVNLAASDTDFRKIEDLKTFRDYTEPLLELMASLPAHEKVIVVGHSLGGLNLSLAMELYSEKILVAVFLTAFLPDTTHRPSYVLDLLPGVGAEYWLDTQFSTHGGQQDFSFLFGPNFMSSLYGSCKIEDLELAMKLKRPSSFFIHDLSKANKFSDEKFGSVAKVYIVCKEDKGIFEEIQRLMIKNNGGDVEVKELEGSDHMLLTAMLLQPVANKTSIKWKMQCSWYGTVLDAVHAAA